MHICPYVIQVDVKLREWTGDAYTTISDEFIVFPEVCDLLGHDKGVDEALLTARRLLTSSGDRLLAAVAAVVLNLGWEQPRLPFD
jgi:hypothetical protein